MPINAHPDYITAEKEYLEAISLKEKLLKLKKMISVAPSHKGAENLRQQLTKRRKKLEAQIKKIKKSGKLTQIGIKKQGMQAILIGNTNSGKSSLLSILTNAKLKISKNKFTTTKPIIGIINYKDTQIQLIENPAINSEKFDKGLPHTTDTILMIITKIQEIKKIQEQLKKSPAKKIIIFNKIDKFTKKEKRKISANLSSKKYNFILISTFTLEGIKELKEKLFQSFDYLRIYTKEPGKNKSKKPMILKPNSTIKDVAEKILKGFSKNKGATALLTFFSRG
jgi:ribosome-interacting GTPase 1